MEAYKPLRRCGGWLMVKASGFNLIGFIRRGPTDMKNDKGELVPFNMMSAGMERHLAVMGDLSTAKRVYVGEPPIDSMSLCQKDGLPKVIMALG